MARRLMGRSGETGISPPPRSPLGDDESLPVRSQVLEDFTGFRVPGQGPAGNGEDQVRRAPPFLVLSFSVLSSSGVVLLVVAKIEEGGELTVGLQDDIPALSPVAPVGASVGNILLTAKTDAAVPSVSSLDEDFYFIDELDRSDSPSS